MALPGGEASHQEDDPATGDAELLAQLGPRRADDALEVEGVVDHGDAGAGQPQLGGLLVGDRLGDGDDGIGPPGHHAVDGPGDPGLVLVEAPQVDDGRDPVPTGGHQRCPVRGEVVVGVHQVRALFGQQPVPPAEVGKVTADDASHVSAQGVGAGDRRAVEATFDRRRSVARGRGRVSPLAGDHPCPRRFEHGASRPVGGQDDHRLDIVVPQPRHEQGEAGHRAAVGVLLGEQDASWAGAAGRFVHGAPWGPRIASGSSPYPRARPRASACSNPARSSMSTS